ncbi:hypothetical protein SMICM17S_04384 [Streptomyces microflavus]
MTAMTPRTESAPVPAPAPSDAPRNELLQSVVDVARAIFGAAASSVLLLDEEADELVFRAVSGEGQEFLVGRRFPAGRGISSRLGGDLRRADGGGRPGRRPVLRPLAGRVHRVRPELPDGGPADQ